MNHLYQDFESIGEFIPVINKFRKANKNKWFGFIGTVAGKQVKIKNFDTWLQVLEVDGVRFSSSMDIPVKEWTEVITQAVGVENNER